jgi:hypothetical protein
LVQGHGAVPATASAASAAPATTQAIRISRTVELLTDNGAAALRRIVEEERTLGLLAKATFDQTLGASPEEYLRPQFGQDGVTLELLAELFSQAHAAGAVDGDAVGAAGLFERLRERVAGRSYLPSLPSWPFGSTWHDGMLRKLRYAAACFEDVNRVRSLKLLVEEADRSKGSVRELLDQLAAWKESAGVAGAESVWAYRLA